MPTYPPSLTEPAKHRHWIFPVVDSAGVLVSPPLGSHGSIDLATGRIRVDVGDNITVEVTVDDLITVLPGNPLDGINPSFTGVRDSAGFLESVTCPEYGDPPGSRLTYTRDAAGFWTGQSAWVQLPP